MNKGQRAWLAVIIFTVSQVCAPQAHAALIATRSNSSPQVFSSGYWAVIALSDPVNNSPLSAYSIPSVGRDNAGGRGTYFYIKNIGTLATLSANVTVSSTISTNNAYTIKLESCAGTWNTSTGSCSSGLSTILNNSSISPHTNTISKTVSWSNSFNPASYAQVRLSYSSSGNRSVSATVSIAVSRADVRSATNTSA